MAVVARARKQQPLFPRWCRRNVVSGLSAHCGLSAEHSTGSTSGCQVLIAGGVYAGHRNVPDAVPTRA